MHRLVGFVVSVVVLASACGHRRAASVAGPGMNAKRTSALLEQASAALSCDRAQLVGAFEESIESNYHVYRVDGCGRRFVALLHCTGICNWRQAPEMLAERQLNCPVTQLQRSYQQGAHVFTLSGCGQTAQYELGQGRLTPVTHSAVETSTRPPVAPAPAPAPAAQGDVPPPPPPPPAPPVR